METKEMRRSAINGWLAVALLFVIGLGLGYGWYATIRPAIVGPRDTGVSLATCVALGIGTLVWIVCLCGFFTLQPNISAVLILFGRYTGSVMTSGFHWANPLLLKKKVSLRAHNLNGDKLKVNDLRGNPIEIALVIVWRVTDTARAVFDVEDFRDYISVQSEAALRHMAMSYSYDTFDDGDASSLRGSVDEVSASLQKEVQERVARAGILIEEARISHLAYAPEIASAMLQRQQADAVVAARSRIVEGAVGMVEMALEKLAVQKMVELDDERRASMVSNLMVVLCGHEPVHPVINTGTLYA